MHIEKGLVVQRYRLFIFAEVYGFEEGRSKPRGIEIYLSVKSVRLGPSFDVLNLFGSAESNPYASQEKA